MSIMTKRLIILAILIIVGIVLGRLAERGKDKVTIIG